MNGNEAIVGFVLLVSAIVLVVATKREAHPWLVGWLDVVRWPELLRKLADRLNAVRQPQPPVIVAVSLGFIGLAALYAAIAKGG